ncbi:hypothetical protein HCN44_006756 [Aphidius gifuensis]|uniref:Integrator complex subunit 9-like C-terminal domain-containing protein n=1 Tax=Aphidius gifuensis TaxID=684658 RepID=A0A834Y248_APHGI|nr:hypothetical protein HCN44_006756 [Aphidius gifuensis]
MLGELCMNVAMTLRSGGCVLIPCYPSGVVHDLFEFYLPEEPAWADGFSNDYRQPCVVFCGHPSLRFGDAVHFVQLWEPDFPYLDALAPFQPLAMKAVHCPIDTSLNFIQANKLIRDLKPDNLVVPECYTQPPYTAPHRVDLVIDPVGEKPLITFKRGEVIKLPLKRKKGRVFIEPELAGNIIPSEIRPGLSLASVTGELEVKDNVYTIKYNNDLANGKKHEYGHIDPQELVIKLSQEGIPGAKVQHTPTSTNIIFLRIIDDDTIIQLGDNSTHIICNRDQHVRRRLRSIIMQCLKRF